MVTEEVTRWLQVQNSDWYKKGDSCCCHWHKAVGVDGENLEKWGV